jgi:hypothetical protein
MVFAFPEGGKGRIAAAKWTWIYIPVVLPNMVKPPMPTRKLPFRCCTVHFEADVWPKVTVYMLS